jgi:hypothetical protein
MNELPFFGEDEIPKAPCMQILQTKVNSQPMENTPFIAPFVPVNIQVCRNAIEFAALQQDDILVDLGCGDGRILVEASSRVRKAIGIEYDEFLVAHVQKEHPEIDIRHQDMFTVDLVDLGATVLILYLLPQGLGKLHNLLSRWLSSNSSHRCITIGYSIPEWNVVKEEHVVSQGSFMGGTSSDHQSIYWYDYTSIHR